MVVGEGGSAKSDFINKGALIKHLMRGGGGSQKGRKSSDVLYGRPLSEIPGISELIRLPNIHS